MKRIILSLIVLVSLAGISKVYSQWWPSSYHSLTKAETLDTADLEVTYEVKMQLRKGAIFTDTVVLLIGNKYSQMYNPRLWRMQRQQDSLLALGKHAPTVNFLTFPEDVYCNLVQKRLSSVYRTYWPGPKLLYTEEMPKYNWQIDNTDSTILSYPCTIARMRFRGRDYKALFTLDIPRDVGPWKFGKLPGLILHIEDKAKDYSFRAIGIKQCTKPILYWLWNYKKHDRSGVRRIVERMHKAPIAYMRTVTEGNVLFRHGDQEFQSPYNPIELE